MTIKSFNTAMPTVGTERQQEATQFQAINLLV